MCIRDRVSTQSTGSTFHAMLRRVFSSTSPHPTPDKAQPLPCDGAKFLSVDGHNGKGVLACSPYPSETDGSLLVDLCFDCGDYVEGLPLSTVTVGTASADLQPTFHDPMHGLMRVKSTWLRGNSVGVAEDANSLCRPTMEDAHTVVDHFHNGAGFYLGVYDGHGGADVAEYAAERLHELLETELTEGGVEACIETAFARSFHAFQREVEGKELTGGCTAAVGLIMNCPSNNTRVLYSGNAGDARVVLCSEQGGRSGALRMSKDHKPTDREEQQRIEALGGVVLAGRVQGCLAVSRALGDLSYTPFVSQEPYFARQQLQPEHKYLIVACDGVFDVLEDEECAEFLSSLHKDLSISEPELTPEQLSVKLAHGLVDQAMTRGTTDNVTAMVALL
eukprot:TRINITY_DN13995_c0_g1_i1.p1 TRINITY_DN13995_c0_g1~~TRINITY_DN13995_c0_g1_i1.p1  ORF type:complete len:391 (+),score=69.40 TRINITY_DN13995_c0_g1_i1:120-1292(+)